MSTMYYRETSKLLPNNIIERLGGHSYLYEEIIPYETNAKIGIVRAYVNNSWGEVLLPLEGFALFTTKDSNITIAKIGDDFLEVKGIKESCWIPDNIMSIVTNINGIKTSYIDEEEMVWDEEVLNGFAGGYCKTNISLVEYPMSSKISWFRIKSYHKDYPTMVIWENGSFNRKGVIGGDNVLRKSNREELLGDIELNKRWIKDSTTKYEKTISLIEDFLNS